MRSPTTTRRSGSSRRSETAGNVGDALKRAAARLEAAGVAAPRRNAEILLAALLETDRGGLLVRRRETLGEQAGRRFEAWVAERCRRVPVQHILGYEEFHGLRFEVGPNVLVPRPETEQLVDTVLSLPLGERTRAADLGTGSGCIGVTLALRRPSWRVLATDASPEAVAVARRNAIRHGVVARIDLHHARFDELPDEWSGSLDVVASNPPYVSESEWERLEPEVRDHDPREALVAGDDGLDAYRLVVPAARSLLGDGGYLVLELGAGQHEAVAAIVRAGGFGGIRVDEDLAGIPRVLLAASGIQ